MMDERELIELIWHVFGVAVDYDTSRKDIIKVLRRLAT